MEFKGDQNRVQSAIITFCSIFFSSIKQLSYICKIDWKLLVVEKERCTLGFLHFSLEVSTGYKN